MVFSWLAMPRRLIILVLTILSVAFCVPTTYAFGPNSGPQGQAHGSKTQQDALWLKAKFEYRVFSGIIPGQGKGANTHPSILSTAFFNPSVKGGSATPNTAPPSSYSLSIGGDQYTAEPGDGGSQHYNFGPNESNWQVTYDDNYAHYSDYWMVTLCGPGAADIASFYWPVPLNYSNYANVADALDGNVATSWNGTDVDNIIRMRGYMVHMAFQIKPPTWNSSGMLPQTYYQTGQKGGTTLQVERDALNWEISGHGSNWSSYFYANDWNNNYTTESAAESALHSAIVNDLYYNNAPVVVEVNTSSLPNWSTSVKHFVAIIGYDDVAGTYKYLDTCKNYTGCDGKNQDATYPHVVPQHSLAQGVYSIPTNKTMGDGGWVW